jgi:DNA-binding XRE family transcriptional regulator
VQTLGPLAGLTPTPLTRHRMDGVATSPEWAACMRSLGIRVRRVREFLGLSQGQVARAAGVSQGAVSRLEVGSFARRSSWP